jgi:hypothetical protein
MTQLVDRMVAEYGGGQAYFTAMDKELRDDRIPRTLVSMAYALFGVDISFVVSGAFGLFASKWTGSNEAYWVPGGLRNGERVVWKKAWHYAPYDDVDISAVPNRLVFLDDSFYKGRTYDAICAAARGRVIGAVVAYDGSWQPRKDVFSLYRWRDRVGGSEAPA